jgi:hypothetical protein
MKMMAAVDTITICVEHAITRSFSGSSEKHSRENDGVERQLSLLPKTARAEETYRRRFRSEEHAQAYQKRMQALRYAATRSGSALTEESCFKREND